MKHGDETRNLFQRDLPVSRIGFYLSCLLMLAGLLLAAWQLVFPAIQQHRINQRVDRYTNIIWKYAGQYEVPTELIKSIIRVESKGRPEVRSTRGAMGLMQVTPLTLEHVRQEYGIEAGDLFQPEYNVLVGTAYLKWLYHRFDRDLYFVLAAYHAGPSIVRKWIEAMPNQASRTIIQSQAHPATLHYIDSIMKTKKKDMQ